VLDSTRRALVARLAQFDRVVELGIGRRVTLARALAAQGVNVTATDIRERSVPRGVTFVRDDAIAPDHDVYAGADAIYALNWPPELHRPALDIAEVVDATLLFTTLGGDQPTVPVRRVSVPGETIYFARERPEHSPSSP
jgi:uncharacterized UPF0146 family protein